MALRNFLNGLISMPVVHADDEEELVDPQTTLRVIFWKFCSIESKWQI